MKDSEVLVRMQEVISVPQKWVKHDLTIHGRHCAVGALGKVLGVADEDLPQWSAADKLRNQSVRIYLLLSRIAGEQFPNRAVNPDGIAFIEWLNDHNDTTHADVILVIEKARAELQEKGR